MGKQEEGLYEKYIVQRRDGHSNPGGKHWKCQLFVLDLHCDKYALPALKAYARACAKEYPELAKDLRKLIRDAEANGGVLKSNKPEKFPKDLCNNLIEDDEDDD